MTQVDEVIEKLVFYATCTQCKCATCGINPDRQPATKKCFDEHPGWVNISPHSIRRVLESTLEAGGQR